MFRSRSLSHINRSVHGFGVSHSRREAMKEPNICDMNHLDADVRLPPRKRLLAGLKKQSCDSDPPLLSLPSISNDFSNRLRDLLGSNSKSPHTSDEEIVNASRSAALAAAEVAAVARAAAEEKAAVAAKAAAAAKSALELLASFSEKTSCKKRGVMKNRSKKHVPVKLLYKRHQTAKKRETDEELAHRLHRAMNSSPRISKNSVNYDCKNHHDKKHKNVLALERNGVASGKIVGEGNMPSTTDRNSESDEVESEGSFQEVKYITKVDKQTLECSKADCPKIDKFPANGEAEASHSVEKYCSSLEDTSTIGIMRGKIKRKKLSLSLCAIRDLANSKEEPESKGSLLNEEPKG
ncbi:hypothetical protein HHK36_003173 [Tetracentron sinense]|uniref:Uncharacterized protein n=1 Tax=Tetracentron sinense TaxID=13715 RepID=A0A835DP33_TETSI|nr:hypothetical protein HHK36_003173 [Tetracentron sinense]